MKGNKKTLLILHKKIKTHSFQINLGLKESLQEKKNHTHFWRFKNATQLSNEQRQANTQYLIIYCFVLHNL